MSIQIQWRGGATSEHDKFFGADREITVDTDKHTAVVHDGETSGGFPLAREDWKNVLDNVIRERIGFVTSDITSVIFATPADAMTGFLLCDGAEISREAYASLFAKIGAKYGEGDGKTTFNLPDFRGMFLRGRGGNSAEIGIRQLDAAPNITGVFEMTGVRSRVFTGAFHSVPQRFGGGDWEERDWWASLGFNAALSSAVYGRADEVRVVNQAINFFMKY